jgi:hypothetical protein
MTTRWQVEAKPYKGFRLSFKTGTGVCDDADRDHTEIRYRAAGSRGRWRRFVLQGKAPANLQKLVSAYEKSRAER